MAWGRFRKKKEMPEGVWIKCRRCGATLFQKAFEENLNVCKECGFHAPVSARRRLELLLDEGSFEERWPDLFPTDSLQFVDKDAYPEKLAKSVKKTGELEAATAGSGRIHGKPVAICVLDFTFMGGSMGSVVGEKVTRTVELGAEELLPTVVVSSSGGARMHEGAVSLMQMAKTSAALERLGRRGVPFYSVLTDPTTGGVTASFAALGDVIVAEPGALIGFAGPRVIQETLRTELPEGFQRSEFLLEKGMLDLVVDRRELKAAIANALGFMGCVKVVG
ncbi:MAG TPA: acetyl-CoA carboxylase, carboxyltransferase subunit beta, partial [Planctomycetota bacterium]|nr:acetyl-CoA carboxylase, carboxyltransferase subunit beta [Planctomycetota bacterium]